MKARMRKRLSTPGMIGVLGRIYSQADEQWHSD